MEGSVIVMIVTLAMPNGQSGYSVKPMANVDKCMIEAQIEASDPFVAGVECSEIANGELKLKIKPVSAKSGPETSNAGSAG